jgi:hypothetical protein
MLAQSPQNPDGAELVLAATQGGVLHPPGFPLQTWIDKALVQITPLSPALGLSIDPIHTKILSLASLLFFSFALFFLGITIRRLGASLVATCFGVICFALFPPAWRLAVQPEKYALFFLLLAALSAYALRPTQRPLVLALLFGLLLAQHVIGLLALPLLFPFFSQRSRRDICLFVLGTLIVSGTLYLSLLALSRPEAWPDWGKLQSFSDLIAHVTRQDLGFFTVDPQERIRTSALAVLCQELWYSFFILLLLLPFGLRGVLKNSLSKAWGAALLLSLGFVFIAQSGGYPEIVAAWLERYTAVPMFFLSAFFALGWHQITSRMPRAIHWLSYLTTASIALVLFFCERPAVDASKDVTLDLYTRELGALLPEQAFYTGGNDLEYFYGAVSGTKRRFPIFGEYEWYRNRAMPKIEPRFSFADPFQENQFEFDNVNIALAKGLPVYSTLQKLLEQNSTAKPFRRGLFWVLLPGKTADRAEENRAAALKMCELLEQLPYDPPEIDHFYSRYLWQMIGLAFMDTSDALKSFGDSQGAIKTAAVAYATAELKPAIEIKSACQGMLKTP